MYIFFQLVFGKVADLEHGPDRGDGAAEPPLQCRLHHARRRGQKRVARGPREGGLP